MKKLCCVLFFASFLVGMVLAEDAVGATGPVPPPEEKEMTMAEIKADFFDLEGKVVKTTINYATSFEQVDEKWYAVVRSKFPLLVR